MQFTAIIFLLQNTFMYNTYIRKIKYLASNIMVRLSGTIPILVTS